MSQVQRGARERERGLIRIIMQEHVSVSPSGPVIGLEPGMRDTVAGEPAADLGVLTDSSTHLCSDITQNQV